MTKRMTVQQYSVLCCMVPGMAMSFRGAGNRRTILTLKERGWVFFNGSCDDDHVATILASGTMAMEAETERRKMALRKVMRCRIAGEP